MVRSLRVERLRLIRSSTNHERHYHYLYGACYLAHEWNRESDCHIGRGSNQSRNGYDFDSVVIRLVPHRDRTDQGE